ncbi:hypothetical protein A2U01_0070554, partial [Trifolium medium]|nr:hypothetical protein [Trifolium medium]
IKCESNATFHDEADSGSGGKTNKDATLTC